MTELTEEAYAALKDRDERIRQLEQAIAVESETRNSKTLNMLLAYFGEDAAKSLEELATVNPGDREKIAELQARVYRARFTERCLGSILLQGKLAEESLRGEDPVE